MREALRFLLGSELREIREVDPTLTVLDWLRLEERRIGTKEGCAEGDCGACTVVVGRLQGGQVVYEAINACIRFLATLDGCQLLTVEHLKRCDGTLHPVQQALVDRHGSQCGFCTPGFVMSLYALWLNEQRPGLGRINDVLAGNLCRCTGYAPIIAAARLMYDLPARAEDRPEDATARLKELQDEETLATGRDGRRFYAPATLPALTALLEAEPDATLVSGATDVGLWVTKFQRVLPSVIYLGRIAALRRIEETADSVEIGAAATYTEAEAALARLHPDFGELLRRLGALQVRNAGTIGGNIANGSPIGDTPPVLIALGATLVLHRHGQQRHLPIEDFFLAYGKQDRHPDELVELVSIPKPKANARFRAYKITKRFDQDISSVCGAFLIELTDGLVTEARLAYGGMAGTPKRAAAAEQALLGRPWTRTSVEAAMAALAQDFTPLTDWRASSAYRAQVAANLLLKFHIETTEPAAETRLVGARSPAHG
jgi:xanthine dehydrogenase small subunit